MCCGRELGLWRYLGVQVQFLGGVLGFLLAPVLWSFAVKMFGIWHPIDAVLTQSQFYVLAGLMFAGLVGSLAISNYACRAPHLRHLRPITPLVEPYYMLGTMAAWVGLFEIIARPFFWAKTTHGSFGAAAQDMAVPAPEPPALHAAE